MDAQSLKHLPYRHHFTQKSNILGGGFAKLNVTEYSR